MLTKTIDHETPIASFGRFLSRAQERAARQVEGTGPLVFAQHGATLHTVLRATRATTGGPVGFRWCKEARGEFNEAIRQPEGHYLKGVLLRVLERMVGGWLDLTQTHKIIRRAPVNSWSPWTILYSGEDGNYVGLLLVKIAEDQLPSSACQVAQTRLSNLQF